MQNFPIESPFHGFSIQSHEDLHSCEDRVICSSCDRSMKYFCYFCCKSFVPLNTIKLPIHIEIWKHKQELQGKSTATHIKMIANENVDLFTYPDNEIVINEHEQDSTVILYPSNDSTPVASIGNIKRLIVIDGTWNQVKSILFKNKQQFQNIRKVSISTYKTLYWRPQLKMNDECLATVEAVYYFLKEYMIATTGKYDGSYDNLLFLYSFFYHQYHDKSSKLLIK